MASGYPLAESGTRAAGGDHPLLPAPGCPLGRWQPRFQDKSIMNDPFEASDEPSTAVAAGAELVSAPDASVLPDGTGENAAALSTQTTPTPDDEANAGEPGEAPTTR